MESLIDSYRQRVNAALESLLPSADAHPQRLHSAMRYAATAPGKRIRPALVYAAGRLGDVPIQRLDPIACSVELIHAYSLVHDDLPAMDDDDLRRGRPTCHVAFDEATAILAGDALQALAFELLADADISPGARAPAVAILARAAGSRGMAGGQAIDLMAVGRALDLAELEDMHRHKTGALIRASVALGALAADLDNAAKTQLDRYAESIGLAFQILDDILDETSDTATLGKTQGADRLRHKPTYPALLGLEGARAHLRAHHDQALESLAPFDAAAEPLRWLATFIVERQH